MRNERQKLGELLVEQGLISLEQLKEALKEQKRTGEFLGTVLTRLGMLSNEQLLPVLAGQVGMPYVRVAEMGVSPDALAKVPPKFASHYHLIPLSFRDNTLQVAIADPFDVQTLDELKLLLDCELSPVLASQQDIEEAVQRHYGVGASAVERMLDT
ncbi:MAG: hypothetical protein HYY58_05415, partial [Candidatus Omnitrophica bacterium]|nr:hypothetical protein [Candidatus Omnitrophota bacterium]